MRYFGGKFQLGPWIISHFPQHDCYCEPYCGAASVLFQKERSRIEVLNDLNQEVINFFDILRERRDELVEAIHLTPYARAEYLRAQQPARDPLERARRFYVWAQQGRGRAGVVESGGWRFMSRFTRNTNPAGDFAKVEHLFAVAERLRGVQTECSDALTCIERYDGSETLFYVDPPYDPESRSARWAGSAYLYEMDEPGHRALSEVAHSASAMIVLSGYPSELYKELYADWVRVERPIYVENDSPRVEALWLNPLAEAKLKQNRTPLFSTPS